MVDRTQPAQIISLESVRSKERILRAESVRKRFDPPPSRSTLNRWAKQGIIPGAFDLGTHARVVLFAGRGGIHLSGMRLFRGALRDALDGVVRQRDSSSRCTYPSRHAKDATRVGTRIELGHDL